MAPSATNGDGLNGIANGTQLKATAPVFQPAGNTNPDVDQSKYHASSSDEAIHAEHEHAAHNYHPLPVVFARALGTTVWDPEGREYLDFLSAYSAVTKAIATPNWPRP